MINLRYHIVSLTAVFLALGIGLTLGSTFLDRATVDTLESQLGSLERSIDERDAQIEELKSAVENSTLQGDALDAEGTTLLSGLAADVPVIVVTARGADEDDVTGALQALVVAGADVRGTWWLTERFALDDDAALADLAEAVDVTTTDPAQLRRAVVADLAAELGQAAAAVDENAAEGDAADEGGEAGADATTTTVPGTDTPDTTEPTETETTVTTEDAAVPVVDALFDAGFIEFQPVPGAVDTPLIPAGVRLVVIGGSGDVADDLVIVPLLDRLAAGTAILPAVVTSARAGEGEISTAVNVVRQDDDLRSVMSTIDSVEHFSGRAALVLAVGQLGTGVGHFGVADGSTQLLPPRGP